MKRDFFVIWGEESPRRHREPLASPRYKQRAEPNLEVLKESPCLRCELFVRDAPCPYVPRCSKIDEFQRIAAVHCTLYKPYDVFSIAKI